MVVQLAAPFQWRQLADVCVLRLLLVEYSISRMRHNSLNMKFIPRSIVGMLDNTLGSEEAFMLSKTS